MPSPDEYMKSIERSIRNAFMIPDEVALTQEDIRSIRKSSLIDYWSAPRTGKTEMGTDYVLHCLSPMSFSRHEAQLETFRRVYSDIKVPWFTGVGQSAEFWKNFKEKYPAIDAWGARMEKAEKDGMAFYTELLSAQDVVLKTPKPIHVVEPWFNGEFTGEQKKEMGWFTPESVNNHGDTKPFVPQKDGTVLITGGRRTGLTVDKIRQMRHLLNQADMVMMETDNDRGDIKVIEHKVLDDYPKEFAIQQENATNAGTKQKAVVSKTKRAAKRKAQKIARRINRKH